MVQNVATSLLIHTGYFKEMSRIALSLVAAMTVMTVAAWTSAAACCLGVPAAVLFGIVMMRMQRRQWLRFDRLQQM